MSSSTEPLPFPRSHRFHDEKNHRLKPVSEKKRRIRRSEGRDLFIKKNPASSRKRTIASRAPDARDDKWISGLDPTRIHSKPTRPRGSRCFLERRRIWSMERRDHAWKIRTEQSARCIIRVFHGHSSYVSYGGTSRRDIDGKTRVLLPLFSPRPFYLARTTAPNQRDYLFSVCQNEWLMTPRC